MRFNKTKNLHLTNLGSKVIPLKKEQISTPALLIDLDDLETNIQLMAHFFLDKKTQLRPHFKSHKSPMIAHKQISAGAKGITCAKLGEAEVLANAGIKDILIANQIVEPEKIYRVASLAKNGVKIAVAVDSIENIDNLSEAASFLSSTIYVLIEVDVGMKRCGVSSVEEALTLAEQIMRSRGLVFEGIQAYEGHLVYDANNPSRLNTEVRRKGVQEMVNKIGRIKSILKKNGIEVNEISGGGTGTYNITGDNTIWTEIQAGSYVLMDSVYSAGKLPFKNSMRILSTVIHKRPGFAVTDAGLKACSIEQGPPKIMDYPDIYALEDLSEEHGIFADAQDELEYRQKIEYIPSHCCTTVNLYDAYHCVRNGILEAIWPISGRGKIQ